MVCINGYGLRLFAIRLVHASVIPVLDVVSRQELRILHVLRVELNITGITELSGFRRIQEIILQTQCRHNTHIRLLVRSRVMPSLQGSFQVLLVVIQLRVLCDIEIHIRVVPILSCRKTDAFGIFLRAMSNKFPPSSLFLSLSV